MTDVIIVCEGQTEKAFVKRILYPSLFRRNVFVQPRLIASSRRAKGGALNAQRVLRYLRNVLLHRDDTFVTTFFDLYGLPADFPGQPATLTQGEPLAAAGEVEAGFSEAVVGHTGCRPERFIPHIQPYEFESLPASQVAKTKSFAKGRIHGAVRAEAPLLLDAYPNCSIGFCAS